MSIDYRTWYESARAELERLRAEKAETERSLADTERQIAALLQTMAALAPLVGEAPPEPPAELPTAGMTVAVRTILSQSAEPLTAAGIRGRLADMGFDVDAYSNPLATIHTVLRRLSEAGEVRVQEADAAGAGKKFSAVEGKLKGGGHVVGLALETVGSKFGFDLVAGKSFVPGRQLKGYIGVMRRRKKPE